MFIEERHQAILSIIATNGSISTAEIQRQFDISYDSAKRDLRILEEKGLLKRTHGGAIPIGQLAIGKPKDAALSQRSETPPSLLAIAKRAIALLQKDDVIFLPSGEIGFAMARQLPRDLPLHIATNSILIADVLRKYENVHTILMGGAVNADGNCEDGFALDLLKRLRFDKAFVTTAGISAHFGLSVPHGTAITFWHTVFDVSRQCIGLYPSEKVGVESAVSLCPITRLALIITDADLTAQQRTEMEEQDVKLLLPEIR